MRFLMHGAVLAIAGLCAVAPAAARAAAPMEVRVVVVTAFEIGEDTGDKPGEFQAWASVLPQRLAFPAGARDLRYDPKTGVLAINTGMGTNRAATSVMALGADPRFDLRHAYWLVAAIAGVNPNTASVGSAAWIGSVVDTDYGYEIDSREIPAGWPTGRIPLGRIKPYETPVPNDDDGAIFPLNTGLRDWAFGLTQGVVLPDSPSLQAQRAPYVGDPEAQKPPQVMIGDEATGQTFWHGELMNQYAEQWTAYWTGGKGRFVMTAMEDSGVVRAVQVLQKLGRADPARVLVLRTGSNYSAPPPGVDAAASLAHENSGLSAMSAALDAAYAVGRPVVDELSGRWDLYRDRIPGAREALTQRSSPAS
ncbi:purine nucleoside permease [Phenylobacterium sp. LjRoot225]|uniref:purine nucleoside permease n=1 Tax=Phenylobacterium sp. LjRoot225 TaxID=3342285 RepID=UPI003ECCFDFD